MEKCPHCGADTVKEKEKRLQIMEVACTHCHYYTSYEIKNKGMK